MAPADLSGQPNYRQVVITAQTQDNPPPKLTAADLRLYQGNKQLAISFLQPQPVTVGILVDNYGMDSASTSSLEQAIDEAQRINAPIYSIGIGETADLTHLTDVTGSSVPVVSTPVMGYGPEGVKPLSGAAQSQVVDTKTLRTLSDSTGAETFIVEVGSKNESLKRATTAIANKISNQYIIGFIGNGSTSELRIESPQHKEMVFKIESSKS